MQISNAMPDFCFSLVRVSRCVSFFRPAAVLFFYVSCAAFFACAFPARAADNEKSSWRTSIEEHHAIPGYLIAVDKSRQRLSLFERRSPLMQTRLLSCTTGQVEGDKEKEGDLKTPEGIYFVVQRIESGLEYLKYGNEAYTLNYPNPVDRIRKKTGYGIWIHGRGEPLAPLQTQGCISLNNEDLASIRDTLYPGAPVALTESFSFPPDEGGRDVASASVLEKQVRAWAKAWSQRSPLMFDFYDKQAYSIAQGEEFSRFRAHKESLFKRLPWIRNSIRDIQILRGPGYWVTWFHQDYRAPNLSTSGVRRLYWAQDSKGDFKILGMEWMPGMSAGTLLASADPALPPLETQARAGLRAQASPSSTGEGGRDALSASKTVAAPAVVAEAGSRENPVADGTRPESDAAALTSAKSALLTRFVDSAPASAETLSSTREKSGESGAAAEAESASADRGGDDAAAKGDDPGKGVAGASSEDIAGLVSGRIEAWRAAWESGDMDAYLAFYAPGARQGSRAGIAAIRAHKRALWNTVVPVSVTLDDMRIALLDSGVEAVMRQDYRDSGRGGDTGVKTLVFENSNGLWLITQEKWSPLSHEARR
ncbi:MAG: L,D-transpeptidase family protein [Desulfovibrio sp.]|nr:L,D-transpeptidase family protein [Desulfovibrio sp.]